MMLAPIRNHHCADFSAAFHNAHDRSLVLYSALGNHALPALWVHEASRAADESLVYLDVLSSTAHFAHTAILQCQTQTMENKPRGLLSNSQSPPDLIGTDSVLAVDQHPKSDEPLVQCDCGILEYRSYLDGELFGAFPVLALPTFLAG